MYTNKYIKKYIYIYICIWEFETGSYGDPLPHPPLRTSKSSTEALILLNALGFAVIGGGDQLLAASADRG